MNVPKLRFKDDDGCEFPEWKETKVLDFAPLQRGFDLPVSTIVDGEFPVVFSNGILKHHNQFKSIAPGVVTGRSGTIGNVTYVNENYWPHNTALWVTDFKQNLPKFVYYFYIHFDLARFGTGSGVPTLNRNDVHRETVLVPTSFKEQSKIANFLTAVDEKIQLLTQKSDLLAQYKKGVMQKIFSQELRFKDDDGREFPEWEEKTLRELLDIVVDNRGKTPPIESVGNPLIEVNAIGNRDVKFGVITKYVSDTTYENWFRKHIKDGDVLFSTVGATALCSYFKDENSKSTIAQNIVGLRFKLPNSGLFMFYLLTEKNNNQKFKTIEMGAVQPSVKVSQMIHLVFKVPLSKEQTKIANFLTAIDDKITQTQAELDAVKQYKQGLLQQMFV